MAPIATSSLRPTPASHAFTFSFPPAPPNALKSVDMDADDWRADLRRDGYAVVKGAIPRTRALDYQRRARAWVKSFGNDGLDYADPATWVKKNLPVHSGLHAFPTYGGPHERFMWEARQEPGVVQAFAQIWGTDELLVSFDSLNVTLPNRTDVARRGAWEHVDQSPLRRGMHCVQGIINLSVTAAPDDGGLVVYPGSHRLLDEFLDTQTDPATWEAKDFLYIDKGAQQAWFRARGIAPVKVYADVGDLIVWDSRTIHYGGEPGPQSTTIRTVIYASYAPARLATPESLARKAEAFRTFSGTTHWPHDNISVRSPVTYLEDGTRDPRDRDQPIELPEMTDQLFRLAGVKPY